MDKLVRVEHRRRPICRQADAPRWPRCWQRQRSDVTSHFASNAHRRALVGVFENAVGGRRFAVGSWRHGRSVPSRLGADPFAIGTPQMWRHGGLLQDAAQRSASGCASAGGVAPWRRRRRQLPALARCLPIRLVLLLLLTCGCLAAVDEGELIWTSARMFCCSTAKQLQSVLTPLPHHHRAAAILRKLRQAIHDTDPSWVSGLPGWQLNDTSHPCSWTHVSCHLERVVAL